MNGDGVKMSARHERKKSYAKKFYPRSGYDSAGKNVEGGGALWPPS